LGGRDIIGLLTMAYSVYTPGVAGPLAVALVKGRVNGRWWFAAVGTGGIFGLLGAILPGAEIFPVLGMGLSLGLALAGGRCPP